MEAHRRLGQRAGEHTQRQPQQSRGGEGMSIQSQFSTVFEGSDRNISCADDREVFNSLMCFLNRILWAIVRYPACRCRNGRSSSSQRDVKSALYPRLCRVFGMITNLVLGKAIAEAPWDE